MSVVTPNRDDHFSALENLSAISFRMGESHFDWNTSTIGLIDDMIVTIWGVFEITLRIGLSRIKVAGVDCVYTRPGFRKRGLMRRTAASSLEAKYGSGYDLSLLNGIESFFDKYCYVPAWPQSEFYIKVQDLPQSRQCLRLVEFTPAHREDLAQIYNRQNTELSGTAVRPTYQGFKWPGEYHGYLWMDSQGNPAGYVIGRFKCLTSRCTEIVDAAGKPEQVLLALATLAEKHKYDLVFFLRLPFNSSLARTLRRLNSHVTSIYKKTDGCMVRIVNLNSLMRKLSPEFSRRIGRSHLSRWIGDLSISNGQEEVTLSINRSRVSLRSPRESRHSIQGGGEIAQLIVRTESADILLESSVSRLTGDANELANVLFPAQQPQISAVDL